MPQDMSQVPMNYRPAMQYTGRMRDLLYAPGYQGLQNDLVKMERDKLQRQYDVETSPEAHLLFSLRERDRLQRLGEQEEKQRRAEMERRMLSEMQRSQALNDWNTERTGLALSQMRIPQVGSGMSGGLDVVSPFAGSGAQIGLGHGSGGMFGRSTDPNRRF